MAKKRDTHHADADQSTPVGIIISQGTRAEDAPRFAAYIWAPAPTDADAAASTRAA
ncbi:MAG TPA: hypothetical protein VNW46_12680 [Gemmatimonadaceae bacterium]|jgi:hypothetical protein|nr:hypothetical protein [Gemmatimonadaceae bacterium]